MSPPRISSICQNIFEPSAEGIGSRIRNAPAGVESGKQLEKQSENTKRLR